MKLPSLYTVAAWFSSFEAIKTAITTKGAGVVLDVRKQVMKEASANYEHLTGRYDMLTTVPTKTLFDVITEKDEKMVEALGAYKEDGEWKVPDGHWDEFLTPYGKPIPSDLIDTTARLTKTKDGLAVEAYKLPSDELKGPDSTALPIMYGALPIIGMLSYMASYFNIGLGLITVLLAWPYLKAIALSEGVKEAGKSLFFLIIVPVVIVQSTNPALKSLFPNVNSITGILIWLMIGLFVAIASTIMFHDDDTEKSFVGGGWEAFTHAMKWVGLAILAMVGVYFLGATRLDWAAPAVVFGFCCLYPMVYSQIEYNKRAKLLAIHSLQFNQATAGALGSAHIIAKIEQAKKAAYDTSPLYSIARATGMLTKKEYGFAPDKGVMMMLSLLDTNTHEIGFGGTGSGKTASVARPRALAIKKLAGAVGAYIDDGKQSLVNELKSIMDIVVEPGKAFAYCEGLDAQELATALNRRSKKQSSGGDSAHWEQGTDQFIEHTCVLLEAFKNHERTQRQHAIDKMRVYQPMLDKLKVELLDQNLNQLEKMEKESQAKALVLRIKEWKELALRPYRWYWNIKSVQELAISMNQVRSIDDNTSLASELILGWVAFLGHKASDDFVDRASGSIHAEIGMGGLLDNSIQYATQEWPMMPDATRGSFYSHVTQRLGPLMRNPKLVDENGTPWHTLETGLRIEDALYGKMVGPNLPEGEGGAAALIVSALCKQRLYKQIKKRLRMSEKEWRALGQKPMQVIWDECQDLVGDDDVDLLAKARSGAVSFMFLTQGFDSLVTAFGNRDVASNFANNCLSWSCFRASPETYEYLSKRLGTALMTTFKEPTQGIDFHGAVSKYLNSSFNDINHPNRQAIRRLEKNGSARFIIGRRRHRLSFGTKEESMTMDDVAKGIVVNIGGGKEIQPIFKPEEFSAYLAAQGYGIVYLHRAGSPRVDLAKFDYIDADTLREAGEKVA